MPLCDASPSAQVRLLRIRSVVQLQSTALFGSEIGAAACLAQFDEMTVGIAQEALHLVAPAIRGERNSAPSLEGFV